jgi:hypothetical protein
VKLTASGIHRTLRSRLGFGTHHHNSSSVSYQRKQSHNPSSLLFYLNHPVQFVYVAGVVVAFDDYKRLWVFTVDDSGGATIDVTRRKPEKVKEQNDKKSAQYNGSLALARATTVEARKEQDDATVDAADARMETPSRIDIGSVVKVKGTIGTFRSVRQIALERIEFIIDTNSKVRFRMQRAQLFADVLSKPWTLSAEEQKRLLKEAEGKVEDNKEKAARGVERLAKKQRREKRHAEDIAKAYEIEEQEREGSGGSQTGRVEIACGIGEEGGRNAL